MSADSRALTIRLKKGLPPTHEVTAPVKLIFPPPGLCTDNGVMVAWAGIEKINLGISDEIYGQVSSAQFDPSNSFTLSYLVHIVSRILVRLKCRLLFFFILSDFLFISFLSRLFLFPGGDRPMAPRLSHRGRSSHLQKGWTQELILEKNTKKIQNFIFFYIFFL